MIRNGVDVDKLGGMVEAVKHDPKLAALRFSVHSEWKGGLKAEHSGGKYTVGVTSSHHKQRRSIVTDEPMEILGSDSGVSPAEMALASLASCLMVGLRGERGGDGDRHRPDLARSHGRRRFAGVHEPRHRPARAQ